MTKIDHFILYGKMTKENMKKLIDYFNETLKDTKELSIDEKCILFDLLIRMESVYKSYTIRDSKFIEGLIAGIEMYTDVFKKITY